MFSRILKRINRKPVIVDAEWDGKHLVCNRRATILKSYVVHIFKMLHVLPYVGGAQLLICNKPMDDSQVLNYKCYDKAFDEYVYKTEFGEVAFCANTFDLVFENTLPQKIYIHRTP